MGNTGDHPYSKKNWEKTVVFMLRAVISMHSLDYHSFPFDFCSSVNICDFADKAMLGFSAGFQCGQ